MSMDFITFCRDCGVVIDTLPPYGVWRRYPTIDHPKKRNGAVKWMETHGFVQNHALMAEPAVWHREKAEKLFSEAEKARFKAIQQTQRERERTRQERAVRDMKAYWARLSPLRDGHPYLERKGLSMQGCSQLKVDGDLLVIPMYRLVKQGDKWGWDLSSVQTIAPDGSKKFRLHCPVKGATYRLWRKNASVQCFCEGFATGLAIYQSIPNAIVTVCFNAGNLVEVAKTYRPKGWAVVCADNDHATRGNPGVAKGKEAASIMKCGLAYPEGIAGTDWDDARREWEDEKGERIRQEIMKKVRMVS